MFEVVPPVHIKAPERDLWLNTYVSGPAENFGKILAELSYTNGTRISYNKLLIRISRLPCPEEL